MTKPQWFAPIADYVLSEQCPTCHAPAWQDCNAPGKRTIAQKEWAQRGKEIDRANVQHAARMDRGANHYWRDLGTAPCEENRIPGQVYHTIDYSKLSTQGVDNPRPLG